MEKFNQLLQSVNNIYNLLQELCDNLTNDQPARMPEKLLSAQDVMDKLKISRATYARFVKHGELKPRLKGKRHYYYEEDIVEALEVSRKRGRI